LDNRTAATIKKSLGGIRVRATGGYTVDDTKSRLINPGGTDFNISQSSDGVGLSFYFSSTTAAFTGGSATLSDADSILGGVAYGRSDGDGRETEHGAASAPPIRKPTTGRTGSNGGSAGSSDATTDDNSPINLDDLFP
jgi:hypothetical protein